MSMEMFKMMNDELEDLRAFKALALELANRKGFDSVSEAINSEHIRIENKVMYEMLSELWTKSNKPLNAVLQERIENETNQND